MSENLLIKHSLRIHYFLSLYIQIFFLFHFGATSQKIVISTHTAVLTRGCVLLFLVYMHYVTQQGKHSEGFGFFSGTNTNLISQVSGLMREHWH